LVVFCANACVLRCVCCVELLRYEALVAKPFFRNHVVLQVFSVLGFYRSEYFTLMLLDVVSISPPLMDVYSSTVAQATTLGLVMYLFVATIIIWAAFGLVYYDEYLMVRGRVSGQGHQQRKINNDAHN